MNRNHSDRRSRGSFFFGSFFFLVNCVRYVSSSLAGCASGPRSLALRGLDQDRPAHIHSGGLEG
jgi:hypothetical protein